VAVEGSAEIHFLAEERLLVLDEARARRHWPEFEGESEVRPMFEPGKGP
jgi:hypothetical protein